MTTQTDVVEPTSAPDVKPVLREKTASETRAQKAISVEEAKKKKKRQAHRRTIRRSNTGG